MVYNPQNAAVTVYSIFPSASYLGSGVLIQPNIVLTASHMLWQHTGGQTATTAWASTGNSYIDDGPNLDLYNPVQATAFEKNEINNPGGQFQDTIDIAKDFAVIKLSSAPTLEGGGSPGFVGLMQDTLFNAQGGSGTLVGFPNTGSTTVISKTSIPQQMAEYYVTQGYAAYASGSQNVSGTSGGSVMASRGDAFATASVQAGMVGTASVLAGMSSLAIAQIETWLSQSNFGQSPAAIRLYRALFQRTPDPVAHANFSAAYLSAAQSAASALGKPFATATEAFSFNNSLIQGMLASAEFNNLHPNISNGDLINLVYLQTMGDYPTPAQYAQFVGQLDSGAITRAQAVGAIANDPAAIAWQGIWSQLSSPSLARNAAAAVTEEVTMEFGSSLLRNLKPGDAKTPMVRRDHVSWKNQAQVNSQQLLRDAIERSGDEAVRGASPSGLDSYAIAAVTVDLDVAASRVGLRFHLTPNSRECGRDIDVQVSQAQCDDLAQEIHRRLIDWDAATPTSSHLSGAARLLDRLLNSQTAEQQDATNFSAQLVVWLGSDMTSLDEFSSTIEF